jgi:hypothetical protein
MTELAHWMGAKYSEYSDAYVRALNEFPVDTNEFDGKNVAEIGTGPFGGFLPFLKAKKKVSIDPMHDEYEKNDAFLGFKDIEYMTVEFDKEEWKPEFDAIFCKNALDHGDMSFETLPRIASALKDSGKFYLMVNLRIESELNPCHDHSLTVEDFRKYVGEAKLTVLKEDIWATDKIHGDVYKTLCAILQK